MGVDHSHEKFYSALHYAVGNADSLQGRLERVLICVDDLPRGSFPDDETWERYETLMRKCASRAATGSEGKFAATASQMSNDEAAKCLQKAFSIFTNIAESYARAKR